jgi:hypothetical protein
VARILTMIASAAGLDPGSGAPTGYPARIFAFRRWDGGNWTHGRATGRLDRVMAGAAVNYPTGPVGCGDRKLRWACRTPEPTS